MKSRIVYMALLFSSVLLSGCPVHQWPEPKRPALMLNLHYEPDLWLWEHNYDPVTGLVEELHPEWGVDEEHPGTTERYSGRLNRGTMRYVVHAYRDGNWNDCVLEQTFTRDISEGYDCTLPLLLDDGYYEIVVWSDLVENESDSPMYDASDFMSIKLLYADYHANTDYRDGYRGSISETLVNPRSSRETVEWDVTMRRPMAKYEFVTTDLSEFLDKETARLRLPTRANMEDYRVQIFYTGYLPCAYSAMENRLEYATPGVWYESVMTLRGDSDATLGFDYVFINDINNASILVQIAVSDMQGTRVAQSNPIELPLRRDHHTLLRGAFLLLNTDGGVNIDPDYDGDHNVIY